MFLSKLLLNLEQLPQDGTLVAERIHGAFETRSNAAVVHLSNEDLEKPSEQVLSQLAPGMSYFLEVGVARDLLASWANRRAADPLSPHEIIQGLIYYAENKAFPSFVLSETEYLEGLLSSQDDFDLCNGVFGRFAEFDNEIDVESYSEEERVVTLAWHAGGIISNGGFEFLFEGDFNGDPGYVYTAAAFQTIGAASSYSAFQKALGAFGDHYPSEASERIAIYKKLPEEERRSINRQLWDDSENARSCLARYIRDRRERLWELLSTGGDEDDERA